MNYNGYRLCGQPSSYLVLSETMTNLLIVSKAHTLIHSPDIIDSPSNVLNRQIVEHCRGYSSLRLTSMDGKLYKCTSNCTRFRGIKGNTSVLSSSSTLLFSYSVLLKIYLFFFLCKESPAPFFNDFYANNFIRLITMHLSY